MSSTRASESGECDTEPLIRSLVAMGFDVAYYGIIRNYVKDNQLNLRVFTVDLSGVNATAVASGSENELMERCDPAINALMDWAPDVVLEVCGDKFTWYRPDNDHGVNILDCCWRYAFAVGYMYHRTKYKRNWIITDPVLYPRNGEMLGSWPETWPNAILSQESATWKQIIQGRHVHSVARYAGSENWLTRGMPVCAPNTERPYEVVIAGHTHHKRAGQNSQHRSSLWQFILDQCPSTTRVCGRGWDEFSMPHPDSYVGILPTFNDVMQFMRSGKGGPIVTQRIGFNTSKPRFYALNGACPYLFDRDPNYKYCYDRDQRILPMSHPARWDFARNSEKPACADLSEEQRQETIDTVLRNTEPNFNVLLELLSCRAENNDGRFGGYKII